MELVGNSFIAKREWTHEELDFMAEFIVRDLMSTRYSVFSHPVPTDALIRLIEQDAGDLDLYSDLSGHGENVIGFTYIYKDMRPEVFIAKDLSEEPKREHELRRTLAHEYGHVKLHSRLLDTACLAYQFGLADAGNKSTLTCKLTASHYHGDDWQEQQAEYFAGGLLMPISLLDDVVQSCNPRRGHYRPLSVHKNRTKTFIRKVAKSFNVSAEFARERLMALAYIRESSVVSKDRSGYIQTTLFRL
ncbi:MAG: ImmA/IrrE family metallo-endopeptidase [Pyrinomonadaceae bacterium]